MRKIISLILLLSIVNSTFCQETVVFSTKSSSPKEKKKRNGTSGYDNVVKIAPLSFIIGKIPVYYERRINDFISVQAGLGLTSKHYFNDILYSDGEGPTDNFYKSLKWNDANTTENFADNSPYGGDGRKYNLGYTFSVEPRVYFDTDEGLDGFFLGIGYTKSRFNYSSKAVANNVSTLTYTGATVKEFDNLSTLMVSFGSQIMYDHLSLEYTGGVGLRSSKGERYIYTSNGSTGKYATGTGIVDKTGLAFDLTLRVGYHF